MKSTEKLFTFLSKEPNVNGPQEEVGEFNNTPLQAQLGCNTIGINGFGGFGGMLCLICFQIIFLKMFQESVIEL